MNIVQWQTAVTSGETPTESTPDAFYPAGPWEPIGCGLSNGRINGGVEDMETVFCWRRPLSNRADTLPTTSPTEADITERVKLLHIACEAPDYLLGVWPYTGYGLAWRDGEKCREHFEFLPNVGGKSEWLLSSENLYNKAIRRLAVRQLLNERGAR